MSKKYHIGQTIWPKNGEINVETNLLGNDSIKYVVKLGITTIPGVKFIFNKTESIEIGRTGFFELDLKDFGMIISSITVVQDSIQTINENYCYIDFVYYEEGDGNL